MNFEIQELTEDWDELAAYFIAISFVEDDQFYDVNQ